MYACSDCIIIIIMLISKKTGSCADNYSTLRLARLHFVSLVAVIPDFFADGINFYV